jgi:hypothetical protein
LLVGRSAPNCGGKQAGRMIRHWPVGFSPG